MPAAVIIDGKKIADEEALKLSAKVKLLESKHNVIPGLAVVLVGNDPASHIYVASKVRRAKEVGISIFQHLLPENVTQNEVLDLIERLNKDSAVNGILVQLPLPEHLTQNIIIDSINPDKDVDGFTVYNVGRLNTWQDCLEPSTPQGALILIKSVLGDDLSGKKAVVLGRSLIVGRPMASILVRESCTVTLLHSKSKNIESECKNADILVSAIGSPGFITANLVKQGACVIDVGITRVGDKIVGDVDFNKVSDVAGFLTPVPGGVGPMTVICMLMNTIKSCLKQNNIVL
ncbi:MAG: bifunctional methylenetetrahydrofolate dehydrogenase/methenyltetrahydrofolate cyclohydrolase [Candidatus Jidaibacter sp.]|nr:bifunctional methylenetetrahydrofolate dehydrogenase/methenyltetrahydrofolate cyclohydrolase [Candidatus Jidaibacter sp.]